MTTIAYHHESGQISIDGQITNNGVVVDHNSDKFEITETEAIFFTGYMCDKKAFMDFMNGDSEKYGDDCPEISAMKVERKTGEVTICFVTQKGQYCEEDVDDNRAIGSGEQFAMAAMDYAQNSCEAVRYASTRCIYTNDNIKTFDIENWIMGAI